MYAPKVKTKPREHSVGAFLRRSIYKPFNWSTEAVYAKSYVDRRKEKTAKIRKRYRPKKLNRWLSRRMFRGAGKIIWKKKPKLNTLPVGRRAQLRCIQLFNYTPEDVLHTAPILNGSFPSYTPLLLASNTSLPLSTLLKIQPSYRSKISWRQKWQFDTIKNRRFNSKRFSAVVSRMLHKRVKVRALNIFSYLITKRVLTYKSHQNHFWNFTYRRYRFQYKNYYDITNAFLAVGLMDHAEGFLLSILRLTLPIILKIRRFFKFLNVVIKNMPELQDKFSVFKIHIAGKLAGGTKRTKSHSIGYGTLPVQTLDVAASNNFLAYRHIYGEFGLKLAMCKNPKYKSPAMLA